MPRMTKEQKVAQRQSWVRSAEACQAVSEAMAHKGWDEDYAAQHVMHGAGRLSMCPEDLADLLEWANSSAIAPHPGLLRLLAKLRAK